MPKPKEKKSVVLICASERAPQTVYQKRSCLITLIFLFGLLLGMLLLLSLFKIVLHVKVYFTLFQGILTNKLC